jgi:hypothetical protein
MGINAESQESYARAMANLPPSAMFAINASSLNIEGDWQYCILKVDNQNSLEEIKEEYIPAKQECGSSDDFFGNFEDVKSVSEKCNIYEPYANISLNHTMNFDSYWVYNNKSGIKSKFCFSLGYAKMINFGLEETESQGEFVLILEKIGTEEVYFSDILKIPLDGVEFIAHGNYKTYNLPTSKLELRDNNDFNIKLTKVEFGNEEKPGFFKRTWTWFKCLFSRKC